MFGLWAVARHTLRQCLRTKVAALFIVLLVVALAAMPFVMKGDGTLAGRIRTFLAYSTSVTAGLLSLVTIFLGVGILSSDVRDKQIFSVVTKPLARWQYILGRWLGLAIFDAVLLGISAGAIYGLAQYLKAGKAINANDRRAVETEVFAARRRVAPEPLRIQRKADARIKELQDKGDYEDALEAFVAKVGGDVEFAKEILRAEVYEDIAAAMQSVGPRRSMVWEFSGLHVAGKETRGLGQVLEIARQARLVRIRAAPSLLGKLTFMGPVRIKGVDGRAVRIESDSFVVAFPLEEMLEGRLARLTVKDTVGIVADPTLQITYKATPAGEPPNGTLSSYWVVENPTDGSLYREERQDAAGIPATLTVPARVVDSEGRTVVRYVNLPKRSGFVTSVTILHDDVAVLYRVGSFEGNFVRGVALIFVQLAFLAALAVLAGSFVSFSVACLLCFVLMVFMVARDYLVGAVSSRAAMVEFGIFARFSQIVVKTMNVLLPDFARTSPAEALVEGMMIPWWGAGSLGETSLLALGLQTTLLLVIACLIFRKRELARVQV